MKKIERIAIAVTGIIVATALVSLLMSARESMQKPVPQTGRNMDIESYVRNNISDLSPQKETVGGKFYVTNIETESGSGTVEYEDGHNAYTADFTYTIDESGKPEIASFNIRE